MALTVATLLLLLATVCVYGITGLPSVLMTRRLGQAPDPFRWMMMFSCFAAINATILLSLMNPPVIFNPYAFASGLTYTIGWLTFVRAVQEIPNSIAMSVSAGTFSIISFGAGAAFGEPVTFTTFLGCCLLLLGTVVAVTSVKRTPAPALADAVTTADIPAAAIPSIVPVIVDGVMVQPEEIAAAAAAAAADEKLEQQPAPTRPLRAVAAIDLASVQQPAAIAIEGAPADAVLCQGVDSDDVIVASEDVHDVLISASDDEFVTSADALQIIELGENDNALSQPLPTTAVPLTATPASASEYLPASFMATSTIATRLIRSGMDEVSLKKHAAASADAAAAEAAAEVDVEAGASAAPSSSSTPASSTSEFDIELIKPRSSRVASLRALMTPAMVLLILGQISGSMHPLVMKITGPDMQGMRFSFNMFAGAAVSSTSFFLIRTLLQARGVLPPQPPGLPVRAYLPWAALGSVISVGFITLFGALVVELGIAVASPLATAGLFVSVLISVLMKESVQRSKLILASLLIISASALMVA